MKILKVPRISALNLRSMRAQSWSKCTNSENKSKVLFYTHKIRSKKSKCLIFKCVSRKSGGKPIKRNYVRYVHTNVISPRIYIYKNDLQRLQKWRRILSNNWLSNKNIWEQNFSHIFCHIVLNLKHSKGLQTWRQM